MENQEIPKLAKIYKKCEKLTKNCQKSFKFGLKFDKTAFKKTPKIDQKLRNNVEQWSEN